MFPPRSCTKLWRKFWPLLTAGILLALLQCKSKNRYPDGPPDAAEIPVTVSEKILSEDGDNSQPSFSTDGSRMLFVSARRSSHAQPQVYERDMKTGAERRITFQNGSTSRPRYHPREGWIVYSSSTDELKEAPPLLSLGMEITPSKLPAPYTDMLEVYLHSFAGLEIKRVTSRPGYDGEARFTPDGKSLTWTRIVKDRAQTVLLPHGANVPARVLHGLGDNPTFYTVSPDGKNAAWVDWDASFGVSRLRMRIGKSVRDVAADMIVTKADPEFSPDGKWLLWAQKDPQSGLYGIYGYDIAVQCLHHFLFPSEGDRRHPTVTPDMKWLTYTLVSRGRSRIAQVPFEQRTGPCPLPP